MLVVLALCHCSAIALLTTLSFDTCAIGYPVKGRDNPYIFTHAAFTHYTRLAKLVMAGLGGVPDVKELEGRKEGENRPSVQSRDFFWDSITLVVVGTVFGLTAAEAVAEFIRGADVRCFCH